MKVLSIILVGLIALLVLLPSCKKERQGNQSTQSVSQPGIPLYRLPVEPPPEFREPLIQEGFEDSDIVRRVDPLYPDSARELGVVEGTVAVQFHVNASGFIQSIEGLKAHPEKLGFESAAREALGSWKFKPRRFTSGKDYWTGKYTFLFVLTGDSIPDPSHFTAYDDPPIVLNRIEPSFPESARRERIAGRVTIQYFITTEGEVKYFRVCKVLPEGFGFETAAINAIRKWRFKPAQDHSKPVAVWRAEIFRFKLD
jgi:TonB family protein